MKKIVLIFLVACAIVFNIHAQNEINGHEYVDLGLSVKWATCDVGATQPHQRGDRFKWGETTPSDYSTTPSKTSGIVMDNISGNPNYDVARAKWGGSWRMPTVEEFEELLKKCFVKWTTKNGVAGLMVTGRNGNSIFLPSHSTYNTTCTYWTSIPIRKGGDEYAYFFSFDKTVLQSIINYPRSAVNAVRPVSN